MAPEEREAPIDPDFGHPWDPDEVPRGARLRETKSEHRHSRSAGGGFLSTDGPVLRDADGLAPPFELAVLAGGCASAAVDVTIYPLDTLKTRLQAPQGFKASGGYRGLFTGVTAAALGAVPGGAVFFGVYEYSRSTLQQKNTGWAPWTLDAMAGCAAATASCLVRNPAIVVQQRMQVGQFRSVGEAIQGTVKESGAMALYSGLGVSIAREIPFAFIQFPIYEGLKRVWLSRSGASELSPTQGAICGSVAGSVAAAATTPLDLLKTRQMIGQTPDGLLAETRRIVEKDGLGGLLKGIGPRVGWMAVGGYIFFGMYEGVLQMLLALRRQQGNGATKTREEQEHEERIEQQRRLRQQQEEQALRDAAALSSSSNSSSNSSNGNGSNSNNVSPVVALLSGGIAGMVIDLVLYPIDTLKTRMMHGLQPSSSRWLSELRSLFHGIGAAILPAIPAASVFFATYEGMKAAFDESNTIGYFVAAGGAESASCLVRVPAEYLKMKLQVAQASTLSGAVQVAWKEGGVFALYRGLGATLCLDLPFALLQFPLFEYLKGGFARRKLLPGGAGVSDDSLEATTSSRAGIEGAIAGAIAGASAAFLTTPLDVIRTRHVLREGARQPMWETVRAIALERDGLHGFWRGAAPRTMQMGLGGALYLGTYSYATGVLQRILGK